MLVVEDEESIGALVRSYLTRDGYRVVWVRTGEEALAELTRHPVRIVVLDVGLPGIDGLEVCRQVRMRSAVPIVMLTARDEEPDRVAGLELGADDYVVKPFSPRELVLRVQAILRRDEKEAPGERIVHDPLVIDVGAHIVRLKNREITLTATEFRLLHLLARRPGRAYSRDQLLSEVWGYGGEVETRTVDTHMKRLRAKLGPVGVWIETVRGVGYRFRPAGFQVAD